MTPTTNLRRTALRAGALCAAFTTAIAGIAWALGPGTLVESARLDACISESGLGGCTDGKALDAVSSVAFSKDGRSVYATAYFNSSVATFQRQKK